MFDDTLAALLLVREAFDSGSHEQLMSAIDLLFEETEGCNRLTSHQRERVYRDAAIREACRRGDCRAEVANRYGLTPSAVSRIALAADLRLRRPRSMRVLEVSDAHP